MSKRLQNKVALVTGAASGIGFACAKRFAEEGAAVVGLDLKASEHWDEIASLTNNNLFIEADVTSLAAQQAVVAQAVETFGSLDALVTSAGIGDAGPVHMVDEDAWRHVININLNGTFFSTKAVLPQMMEQRSGSIVTIASCEGVVATEGGSSYNASKAGVVNLSKNIAIDYGRMGIRCNALCPGFIETPMFDSVLNQDFMKEVKADIMAQTKLGRFGEPVEMANVALFLASEEASFVTGQAIVADGGYIAGHSHGIVEMMGLT
ncbi:SDR family NAD(P)-dependent oxidoreductase [Candidatus Marimicrobium litorale]|uniref:SDR family oxidoreductase n=1 Tax=Candidatus Marimicrobium litorale TaxID=2518991 RepID=A0ABT3T9K5_9GAMM|nr:SDR family NAD(P)-dependent oxidoreductase [Candidatus Marimicrobium litorale]MCX2978870.1 SDR family oxidoreductase [Candidatus Marimicrobium litorale]